MVIESDPEGRVSLPDLMINLGQRNIQRLLLEAGSELNGSALRSGLVDRVAFFIAPKILGGDDCRSVFSGPGVALMNDALQLRDIRSCSFDNDMLIEGEVVQCSPV